MDIVDNYTNIKNQIAKLNKDACLVAVTKKQEVEKIQELINSQENVIIGENYVQEFEEKQKELTGNYQVHLIGPLQTNKVKKAVSLFDVIQGVHSFKLAQNISKEAAKIDKTQEIYLQVNISEDENKSGFSIKELDEQIEEILKLENIKVLGIMTITFNYGSPEDVRPDFIATRELRDRLSSNFGCSFKISMGMSADYMIAVEEGASLVRVGSSIFGSR